MMNLIWRNMPKVAAIERTVDSDSGELLDEKVRIREAEAEPDYVKLYIRAWLDFKEIKSVNTVFLAHLLPYMTYANKKQRIYLAPPLKREIAEELGWSPKTALNRFNQELRKLVRKGVLSHVGESAYQVNPELVGKGSWADIKELRATFHVIGEDAGKVDVETK